MTTTYQDTRTAFSFRRVFMFGNIYRYAIRRQLIIFSLFSLVAAVFIFLPVSDGAKIGMSGMFSVALSIAYCCGPVVFAKGDSNRVIEHLVPARPAEKMTFYLLYIFIALPLSLYALPTVSELVYLKLFPTENNVLTEIIRLSLYYPSNLFQKTTQSVAVCMTTLYVVLNSRSSRILKGILSAFGMMVLFSILGAIYGFAMAFSQGYSDGCQGLAPSFEKHFSEEVMNIVMDMPLALILFSVMLCIYTVVMICLAYRRMMRPNI